jgi:energy-coupling factor transport system ATP-binding protein
VVGDLDRPLRRRAAREQRRLTPAAIAEAAVLVDVTLALCLIGWVVPYGTALLAAAVVPMSALSWRRGWRAAALAGTAGGGVAFVVMGFAPASNVVGCAVVGGLVGSGYRRGWGNIRITLVGGATIGPAYAGLVVGALWVFSSLRTLAFEQIRVTWRGVAKTLHQFHADDVARHGDRVVAWVLGHWLWVIPPVLVVATAMTVLLAALASRGVLDRLARIVPAPQDRWLPGRAPGAAIGPVPVALRDVVYRYPGASVDALRGVTLELSPGELVAVVGHNGSGKSTVAQLVCGAVPTSGTVERAGDPGLGVAGGTTIVFQRPDCQVLGLRVRDDVVWGLPPGHGVAVAPLLERVGLEALADRESSTLSGGELQRLAVAAALARSPRLLIADEATSMIDPEGRPELVGLFADLAARERLAVLHITHHLDELALADRVVALDHGRIAPADLARPAPERARSRRRRAGGVVVQVLGVRHVFSQGTPWEHEALAGVDLEVAEGETVLLMGHNGSGKSTLSWLVAGLLEPTSGSVLVEGRPAAGQVGHIGLSFQHARLQLLRRSVLADVMSAGGVDELAALAALRLVGLDGDAVGRRRVDALSGGQQRRVVLAGLLARKPAVLVLDEPFAGLDGASRAALLDVLIELQEQTGLALILVSHDPADIDHIADRVVTLDRGRVVSDRPVAPPAVRRVGDPAEASP